MPESHPVSLASVVISTGSQNDAYVNHTELRDGLGDDTFPPEVTDAQIDVVIAAYGEPGLGALNEAQLQQALDDHVFNRGADGRMTIDFNQQEVSGALADAVISHGSSDDLLLNHTEIRSGFEALGLKVPLTERMADVLFEGYGGPNAVVIDQANLRRAFDEGTIRVQSGAVGVDFSSGLLSAPLARSIVAEGSRDDGLVNRDELRDGLRALGFDPRIDDEAAGSLMALYDTEALNVDQLEQAIVNGNLALDGGGSLIAQVQPAYSLPIDPLSTFGPQVRGPNPKPIDRDLAQVAQAVYHPSMLTAGTFTRIPDAQLRTLGIDPALVQDDSTSFKAGLYRNTAGHVVLAFAGTEGLTAGKDWWTNAKQGLGFDAKQYREAVALAGQAENAFGANLVVTGHSLGGGLAATVAMVHDIPAVTFNAAGVHDATLERNGLDPEGMREIAQEGLVRRYVVEGEFLNYGQDYLPVPNAPGRLIALADPNPPAYPPPPLNLPYRFIHSIGLHSMGTVVNALEQQHPWNP